MALTLHRALNHMTVPALRWDEAMQLAHSLGCSAIEYRNDLKTPLFDHAPPDAVRDLSDRLGVRIAALAQVERFDALSSEMLAQARDLMRSAQRYGASAIVLIPVNDGADMPSSAQHHALIELKPMLEDHGLTGLIEPLGFQTSSLRSKAEAVDAIESLDAGDRFQLVHDSFHHCLSGEEEFFPDHTAMVHVSGVVRPDIAPAAMTDADRGLIDDHDRLGNIKQLKALHDAGYRGPVSIEAFSPVVHRRKNPEPAIRQCFEFLQVQAGLNFR